MTEQRMAFTDTSVGAVCDRFGGEVQTGPFGSQLHASDYSENGVPVVMPQDMLEGRVTTERIARVDAQHVNRLRQHALRPGDIAFSRRGDVGRFAVITEKEDGWLCGTGSIRIRLNCPEVDTSYLRWYLAQPTVRNWLEHNATGVTMPNLNTTVVRQLPLAYPSLPEQRRIAAILDQADALRAKRREALAQLDRLAQSVFVEMFGDPVTNPRGWETRRLGELTSKLGSGSTPTGGDTAYKDVGISLIRSLNVHDGLFLRKNLAHIDEQQAAKLRNVVVEENDILLNITGASVARVCRAPADVLPARVNQHVMIVRPTSELNPLFLESLLLNPSMKAKLLKVGGAGATREAITKADAEELEVIVPPKSLQQEFSTRKESLHSLQRNGESGLADLNALFASLQHRAFRGEL